MLGHNSRMLSSVSIQTQLCSLSRYNFVCCDIEASFSIVRLCRCFIKTVADVTL